MSDADELITKAQQQLDEHKKWLFDEFHRIDTGADPDAAARWVKLVDLVREIRLRVARASATVVSVVWEYPDELYAFLRSDAAPEQLRASVSGGHVVDPNQPSYTARREVGND